MPTKTKPNIEICITNGKITASRQVANGIARYYRVPRVDVLIGDATPTSREYNVITKERHHGMAVVKHVDATKTDNGCDLTDRETGTVIGFAGYI